MEKITNALMIILTTATCVYAQQEDVRALLAKAKTIKSIHYSVTMTNTNIGWNPYVKSDVWIKDGYRRQEDDMSRSNSIFKKIISIRTPVAEYKFYPEDKEYVVNKKAGLHGSFDILAEFPTQELLNGKSFQVLGEEFVDGKKTTVLTVSAKMGQFLNLSHTEVNEKIWIWQKNGLPLKTESTVKADQLAGDLADNQTVKTYQYFEFDDIPDNVFDITDMLQNYKEVIYKTTGTVSSPPGVPIQIPASEAEEYKDKKAMKAGAN